MCIAIIRIGRISGDAQVHPLFVPRSNVTGGCPWSSMSLIRQLFFPVLLAAGAAADVKATTAKETGAHLQDGALV